MEVLKKLEEIQRSLMLTKSNSIEEEDSSRFIANFHEFLTRPCGELDFENKCGLVSDYISKISTGFLQKPNLSSVHKDKLNCDDMQTNLQGMAMIGLDAMQRANSTLEDFCRSYFMFHGMDVNEPQSVFKYLPVLSFTESYIYKLDTLNEKLLNMPSHEVECSNKWFEEINPRSVSKFSSIFKTDPFISLAGILDCHGLMTERIKEEFKHGEEYWDLERKLCCALFNRDEILVEDVIKAIHLKSFDYRVLNLLLYQMREEQVDELHMEFLSVSEFLVEVADDLFDYEEDVLENSFNFLRMFVRIYGTSAPTILAKYITEAEEKYNILLNNLDSQLSSDYQRRCKDATREGGNTSKHPLGTWNIPPLILDEELYRLTMKNSY